MTLGDRSALGTWVRIAVFAALLAVVWWVLAEGEPRSWMIGAPLVLGASLAGLPFIKRSPTRWSISGVLRFVPYFLWGSVRGGITTAFLVLTRARTVEPVMVEYRSALPSGAALALFAGVASLLPGSLTAELRDNLLQIHVLDARIPVLSDLQELERHVAAMLVTQEQGVQ